jgi:hypothetical protein
MAILYNLTISAEQANMISEGLTGNWNSLGAVAPELPDTISPFIGSLEVTLSAFAPRRRLIFAFSFKRTSNRGMTLGQWIFSDASGDTCCTRTSAYSLHYSRVSLPMVLSDIDPTAAITTTQPTLVILMGGAPVPPPPSRSMC